ncbi:MAG: maleylpyruvate isomerase N-terminal domain-containing protein [Chloroflexi bacterium]|nr:maleylpyruvate isomerase N-terminal domain-containing protein [Chloroflexota bacterium]
MPAKPEAWIACCTTAHRRLEAILDGLTDDMARRPSRLPGWTVGHLVTHLARNADANSGMVGGARNGDVATMYPGGTAQREADIAAGQGRPAAELRDDAISALRRLEDAWAGTGDDVWATGLSRTFGGLRAVAFTVFMRWREVEVHLADLGLTDLGSPDWESLSSEYIDAEYVEQTAFVPRRLPENAAVLLVPGDRPSHFYGRGDQPVIVRASAPGILQWLMGRGAGQPDWPDLSPWA